MVAGPSWKIAKSPYLGSGWSDFNEIWYNDAAWPSKNLNFENPRWRRPPSCISKNRDISAMLQAISTKFGIVMQFHPLDRSYHWKLKSKTAVAAILKNIKSPYRGRGSSDFYEIWPDDTYALYVRTTIARFRLFSVYILYGVLYREGANSWGQVLVCCVQLS